MEKIDLIQEQNRFIKDLELKGKSFNTLKNYRTDLNIFNQYLAYKKRPPFLKEMTAEQVKDYSLFLEKKYNSPNSIRRRIQALRIFFDWLIEKNLYADNPIKKALVSPKVVDPPRPLPFQNAQTLFNHLEEQIEKSHGLERLIAMRNKIVFYLIYGSGLKVSDVEIMAESSIFSGEPMRALVSPPKRDPYTIALPKGFSGFYQEYKEALEAQKEKDQIEFSNLLFNANPYKILKGGLSARGMEVIFKELSRKLGFIVTAKNLRQSCVFKWLGQNRLDSQIKEWMGVQPVYSLKPYKDLMKKSPGDFAFQEIEDKAQE